MVTLLSAYFACATGRAQLGEEFFVDLLEVALLARDIIFVIDSFYRADWFARTAIHTLVGLDVEHPPAFVDAIHWALLDAGLVLHIDAWPGNDVGHDWLLTFW